MGNNRSTQKTTFWNFLQNNKIEIPIIQRDYAQGRLGKEYLRRSFLSSIKEALDNNNKSQLKLDFVYGSTGNGKMLPLDGQQRLTTLWLLHWYIALHAEALDDGVCYVLSGFSYETRMSSREFCHNLCIPQHFERFDGNDVVGFITTQTWFYSAWKQDPTIQSMLRMLSGTKINDKNGDDIIDGIEELFKDTNDLQFKNYWQILRSDDAPIVFYFLPLNEFKLTDDLYIKMNARGKQLTSFENFKADLIGYITRQSDNRTIGEIQQKEWNELMDPQSGIPIKLDTDWTDIFWKNKSKDNRIDDIYFAFINRFFLNEIVCQKDGNNNYAFTAKQLEENNPVFSYLYGNKSDDTSIDYVGFEKYKDIPQSFLRNLSNTLNRLPSDITLSSFYPKWVGQDFHYIPIYKENSISSLEQKDRIAFHAISKYIQEGTFDAVSFRQWMRVVWNIVENAGVNSISSMIGVMRLIDELSIHSHEVYSFLDSQKHRKTIASNAAQEQLNQEINKAAQILYGEQRADDNPWEDVIERAEQHAFFKGSIHFLYQDTSGVAKWKEMFDIKWRKTEELFCGNGLCRKDCLIEIITNYLSEEKIKSFGSKYGFKYDEASIWKKFLEDDDYKFEVHNILMTNPIVNQSSLFRNQLILLLNHINDKVWLLDNWFGNKYVLTNYVYRIPKPANGYVYAVGTQRHIIIHGLIGNNVRIQIPENNIGEENYTDNSSSVICYRGLFATIFYKDHPIRFEGDDKLFLMEKDDPEKYMTDASGDKYCRIILPNCRIDSVIELMDDLINSGEKSTM